MQLVRDGALLMQIEMLRRAIVANDPPYKAPHEYMNFDHPLTAREAKPEDFEDGLNKRLHLRDALWRLEQAKEALSPGDGGYELATLLLGQAQGIAMVYGVEFAFPMFDELPPLTLTSRGGSGRDYLKLPKDIKPIA